MDLELDRGHDAEVAAAAAQRPEQVGWCSASARTRLAVGGDELERGHGVGLQAVLARQPADAAAERVAGDPDVGRGAVQAGQAVGREPRRRRAPTWRRRRRGRAGRRGRRGPPAGALTFSSSVFSRSPSGPWLWPVACGATRSPACAGVGDRRDDIAGRRSGSAIAAGCWSSRRLKAERASSQPGSPGRRGAGQRRSGERRGEHAAMVRAARARRRSREAQGDRRAPPPSFQGGVRSATRAMCELAASPGAAAATVTSRHAIDAPTSREQCDGSTRSPPKRLPTQQLIEGVADELRAAMPIDALFLAATDPDTHARPRRRRRARHAARPCARRSGSTSSRSPTSTSSPTSRAVRGRSPTCTPRPAGARSAARAGASSRTLMDSDAELRATFNAGGRGWGLLHAQPRRRRAHGFRDEEVAFVESIAPDRRPRAAPLADLAPGPAAPPCAGPGWRSSSADNRLVSATAGGDGLVRRARVGLPRCRIRCSAATCRARSRSPPQDGAGARRRRAHPRADAQRRLAADPRVVPARRRRGRGRRRDRAGQGERGGAADRRGLRAHAARGRRHARARARPDDERDRARAAPLALHGPGPPEVGLREGRRLQPRRAGGEDVRRPLLRRPLTARSTRPPLQDPSASSSLSSMRCSPSLTRTAWKPKKPPSLAALADSRAASQSQAR